MHCPYCGSLINKVVDKRAVKSSGEIRRRRECLKCTKRYTTYERVGAMELTVIKRDGRHQPFSSEKLLNGITRCLEKRPGADKAQAIADRIEKKLKTRGKKEIQSQQIGKLVLGELRKIDKIAYLRFASVYRHFEDPRDFARELESLTV